MTALIKLFYAGAIMALFILLVAFGIRTFYAPPMEPEFPRFPVVPRPIGPIVATPSPGGEPQVIVPTPTPEQQEYEEAQQRYQEEYEAYVDERAEYRRNVFLAASIIGVAAIAGGLMLASRLDAIRLGLIAGGLGTIIYAVFQAEGDLDNAGATLIFVVAGVGMLLIMAAGYRWLSRQEP